MSESVKNRQNHSEDTSEHKDIQYLEKNENEPKHGQKPESQALDNSEEKTQNESKEESNKPVEDNRKVDSIENYDLSEPKSLIKRLGDYSIVNQAFTTYDYIKNSSPLLNAGLSSAENATAIALAYTVPVIVPRVQPILLAVDAKFGVEEKANQLLDIVESKVANATDTIHNTSAYVTSSKNAAQEKLKALPAKSYEVLVDHPLEQLLERLEQLLDRLLPQNFDVERVDAAQLKDQTKLQRATHLGLEVPKRIVNLAQHKYQLRQLSEDQLPGFTFLIDLIQYAVDQIDLNVKRVQSSEAFTNAKNRLMEGKERVEERVVNVNEQYVSPLKSVIEKKLGEIQQSDLRTYAGVMAAIANASELAKRQLYLKYEDSKNLIPEFEAYLESSKKAIQSFDKNDLPVYLTSMRSNAVDALNNVLALISQYVPDDVKQKLPSLNEIGQNLETWRETIEKRLLNLKESNAVALTNNQPSEIKKKDNGETNVSK